MPPCSLWEQRFLAIFVRSRRKTPHLALDRAVVVPDGKEIVTSDAVVNNVGVGLATILSFAHGAPSRVDGITMTDNRDFLNCAEQPLALLLRRAGVEPMLPGGTPEKVLSEPVCIVEVSRIDCHLNRANAQSANLVEFASVTPAFDTSTTVGRLTCGVFATLVQWEKEMSFEDEPLEYSVISCKFDDTPVTRFMRNTILALLEFVREQGDEYMARCELLLHGVDPQRNGAQ